MSSFFPALQIQQPADPLKQLSEVEQLRATAQQEQLGEVQLQEARLNQRSQQVLMQSLSRNNGDYNQAYADAASTGQVTPQMLMQFRTQAVTMQTQAANLQKTSLENHAKINEAAANELQGIKALPPEQRAAAIPAAYGRLLRLGADPQEFAPFVQDLASNPSDANFDQHNTTLMGRTWVVNDALKQLQLASTPTAAQAEAQRAATLRSTEAEADLRAAEAAEKGSPLTRMEHDPSQLAGDKLPAAIGYLQNKIADPTTDTKDVARATSLLAQAHAAQANQMQVEMMKKQAEVAVTQGSATAAARLLVSGDATLSQLKARGSTPEFIASTLSEANRISGGTFNAQSAEAEFDVAKSSANVTFFGSAKSLIAKGGTLDQLADIGKDIPQGQIPVFNSIADAVKAATGSGPIAKYAAVALGVADDYAKVMGGGQGSDTSRTQALKLISEKESPEARAASIEGIRNAVASQANSRIGSNRVLRRMYGDGVPMDSIGNVKQTKTYTQADVDAAVAANPGTTAAQIESAFNAKNYKKQ